MNRAVAALACLAAGLAACGGSSDEEGTAIVCVFTNCKESPDVALADISPRYEVSQEGSRVTVSGNLGYRYNVLTVVRIGGTDDLTTTSGTQTRRVDATDDTRLLYATSLDGQGQNPTVSVDFVRSGLANRSTVTLPATFTIVSPTGPVSLALSAGQLLVDVSVPATETLVVHADGSCLRADGTAFNVKALSAPASLVTAVPGGSRYRIDTPDLSALLDANSISDGSSQAQVASCELQLGWQRQQYGTSPASMHPSGYILGMALQRMNVHYDAVH